MHIYFSGIGGVGLGPLSEIAFDAGHVVSGSDLHDSLMTNQLRERGIDIEIGQDGSQMARVHERQPIDWFVYTAALPETHAELLFARAHGIHVSKRDELLSEIIREKHLKLIAVSGTHGKTTTTGMLVWALQKLGLDPSYSVGTTLSFGPSGVYTPGSEYFVYECDEFDRNMLQFEPHLSLITSLDHDHVDTYPTEDEYRIAFVQFLEQSQYSLLWERDLRYLKSDPRADLEAYDEHMELAHITLAGNHVRHNAFLVQQALKRLTNSTTDQIVNAINSFPGTARRFEILAENLYSDYGHHPTEIAATLQLAREISDEVVLVYQPHQNVRQHEIRDLYTDTVFENATTVYWVPTYISRENPQLEILSPQQLTRNLSRSGKVRFAELNDELWSDIEKHRTAGHLVICMGAGSIDSWLRDKLSRNRL